MSYFEDRAIEDKKRSITLSERYIKTNLKKSYKNALNEIDKDLEKVFKKFADKEKISMREATKLLSKKEGLNELEKISKELLNLKNEMELKKDSLDPSVLSVMKESIRQTEGKLSTLSKKGYVSHLELLKMNIEKNVLKLQNENQINIYDHLENQYMDGYFKGVFNVSKDIGFSFDFAKPDEETVRLSITNKWSGENYSKRLYKNTKSLAADLKGTITNGIIKGESVSKMSKSLKEKAGISHYRARVLVRTESAYIHEQATFDTYKECGIEKYRYLATLDRRTSEICQNLDGRVFDISEKEIGVNYPPMHPNCRSTTVAETSGTSKRLARGANGKNYEVPGNMTYKEWYNNLSEDEKGKMKLLNKKDRNAKADKAKYKEYKKVLGKDMPSLARFKDLKYNNAEEYGLIKKSINDIKNAKLSISDGQFGKKFGKHGMEYVPSLKAPGATEIYREKIYEVRKFYEVRKIGEFKGQDEEVVYYQKGEDLLLTQKNGEFVSLFKGGNENARFKNAREF